MTDPKADPLPLLVNRSAGSAQSLLTNLRSDSRLHVIELNAKEFPQAIDRAREQGARRVLVCGGDGTLALAASCLVGHEVELGIIAGGTLNHFATRLKIPQNTAEAIELAINGRARPIDAGFVNEHLFLNTSSLGAYVSFVRQRKHLERHMGYYLASLLAGLRGLLRWQRVKFNFGDRTLKSPLVFIGLNEREMRIPQLGQPKSDGERGLHVIAVTTENAWQTLLLSIRTVVGGLDPMARAKQLRHWVAQEIELSMGHKRWLTIAMDGELLRLKSPLYYRFAPDVLQVVTDKGETTGQSRVSAPVIATTSRPLQES